MKTRVFLIIASVIALAAAAPAFANTFSSRPSLPTTTSSSTTLDGSTTSTTVDDSTTSTTATSIDVAGNCDEPEHVNDPHCTRSSTTQSAYHDDLCDDDDHQSYDDSYHDDSHDDSYHDDSHDDDGSSHDDRRGRSSDD